VIFFVGSATGVPALPPSPEPVLAPPLDPASPAAPPLLLLPAATPLELALPPELELPAELELPELPPELVETPPPAPVGAGLPLELPLVPAPLLAGPPPIAPPFVPPPLLVAPLPVPDAPGVEAVPPPLELLPPLGSTGFAVPPGVPGEVPPLHAIASGKAPSKTDPTIRTCDIDRFMSRSVRRSRVPTERPTS